MQVADESVMQSAFGSPGFNPDDRLHVKFYKKSVVDNAKSQEAGRPIYKSVDYVMIMVPGDKDSIIDTRVWDDPRNPNSHTARFSRQWQSYKAGGSQEVVTGTPLEYLSNMANPILTPEQVEEFKAFKIQTAEHLIAMPDNIAQKFMGVNELRRKVKIFIDAATSNAPAEKLRSELDKRDHEIAALKNALKEQGEKISQMEKRK